VIDTKLSDWIGETVDIYLINGNYYREVEVVAVDEGMKGVFIKDNPMFGSPYPEPYFIASIAEIYRIQYEGEEKDIEAKVRKAYRKKI
jgi:hypothetical protein